MTGGIARTLAWPGRIRFEAVAGSGSETNQIKDNLTGLIWARNANFAGEQKSWQEALDFIATTNASATLYGGTNDWRLPNRRELDSLVNFGETNSSVWLNSQGFAGVQSSDYWSSTTFAGDTGDAWVVGLVYGIIRHLVKISNPYVWPVRGGQ